MPVTGDPGDNTCLHKLNLRHHKPQFESARNSAPTPAKPFQVKSLAHDPGSLASADGLRGCLSALVLKVAYALRLDMYPKFQCLNEDAPPRPHGPLRPTSQNIGEASLCDRSINSSAQCWPMKFKRLSCHSRKNPKPSQAHIDMAILIFLGLGSSEDGTAFGEG